MVIILLLNITIYKLFILQHLGYMPLTNKYLLEASFILSVILALLE